MYGDFQPDCTQHLITLLKIPHYTHYKKNVWIEGNMNGLIHSFNTGKNVCQLLCIGCYEYLFTMYRWIAIRVIDRHL